MNGLNVSKATAPSAGRVGGAAALLVLIAFLGLGPAAPRAHAASPDAAPLPAVNGFDLRDLAGETRISLRDAIAAALAAQPGHAVEAELEGGIRDGARTIRFEVMVVADDGALYEVPVDPRTGAAQPAVREEGAEAQRELADFHRTLRHTELSLGALVARAEEVVKGVAVAAALDRGGEPVCEVVFVNSRYVLEARLEARAGHLIGLSLDDEDDAPAARPGEGRGDEAGGDDDEDEGEEEGEGDDDRDGDGGHESGAAPQHDPHHAAALPGAGPTLTPLADGVRFSATITHPYLPLSAVRHTELAAEDEKVVREVLDRTKVVGGVECLVLAEKEYEDGALKEISYNHFAQDEHGSVYYFGEDVDEYEGGRVVGHGGAWLVGRNAVEPCLFMPAQLLVGFAFKRENSPPDAEEWDVIEATDAELHVPAGGYRNVLIVKEGDHPDRWQERKYYARGVGLISENRELNLVKVISAAGAGGAR